MKTLLAILGTIVGYFISACSSIAWFFPITHHDPALPASLRYIAASAAFGIAFSALSGFIGAAIGRGAERGVGFAIATITFLVATWSWWETPDHAHWSQTVAVVLMVPAVILGAGVLTHRRTQLAHSAAR